MSNLLNRASQKVSDLRVEIAMVDLQVECLEEILKQKDEEILAIENEISLLQGKIIGLQELKALVQQEREKRLATLGELHAKEETSSGAESEPKTLQ